MTVLRIQDDGLSRAAGHGRGPRGGETSRRAPTVSSVLALQRLAGNAAVSSALVDRRQTVPGGSREGGGSLVVQREILAYTAEHEEILPGAAESASVSFERFSADAGRVRTALQGLIAASKVRAVTVGDRTWFSNIAATEREVRAAFTAAGLPKVAELTSALLSDHNVFVFAHEDMTGMSTLFGTTILSHQADTVTRQTARPPTAYERQEAARVFGGSLDMNRVVIEEDPVMTFGFGTSYARTTWQTVNMPPGSLNGSDSGLMAWLIHEFTHLWQYQHGASIVGVTCRAIVGGPYAYGGEAQLRADAAAGKRFKDYNYEQQGDICANYWERLTAGGDVTAFQPFIDQVRAGG